MARRSTAERPSAITGWQKAFFAAVGALALWVGAWGFFVPDRVDEALPWLVPPLHARFLGAMYLSGTGFMVGALLARVWPTVRVVVPMIAIWTGALLLVSLGHLSQFDFARPQSWVWFAAYSVYPLWAAGIAWRMRSAGARGGGPPLPRSLRHLLTVQGSGVTLLAVLLFLFPAAVSEAWPWAITPFLAQLYGAPFLSYGLGSFWAARQRAWSEVRLYLIGTALFAVGVLLASLIHVELFSWSRPVTWAWFGGVLAATVAQTTALGIEVARRRTGAE